MILFSAGAILASSTSKFGIWIPLTSDEDLILSTESTISTSWIQCIASVGNTENYIPQSWVWSSNKQALLVWVNLSGWRSDICSRWSAHTSLKIFPHQGGLNFWLTFKIGISDLELVFDSHSSPPFMGESVLIFLNFRDSILADKVLMMTHLGLQKRYQKYHACPKCLTALLCGSAFL